MDIRNFVIIAHIDHGKSTLADRMLEVTGTIESRRMRPQYLDQLDLERERGITIKMAPVRMQYKGTILNLIDTPGHSDFSYEVSRALVAVEGAVLLVDATKGIQAQTLSNFRQARAAGLTIVGAVNKVDMNPAHLEDTVNALAALIDVEPAAVHRISAKQGTGVQALLEDVIRLVPPAKASVEQAGQAQGGSLQSLIFDSRYDDHKGILAFVRVMEGGLKAGEEVLFAATGERVRVKEIGYFAPQLVTASKLQQGEIGYIATGLKDAATVHIGDTVLSPGNRTATLPGYREPKSVVFISFYPDSDTNFEDLKKALERLRLNDSALYFEPDSNEALGRGIKVGFLGQLHFEITAERLRTEFGLEFLTSFPSIAYTVREKGETRTITQGEEWPTGPFEAWQPMIKLEVITPPAYLNAVITLAPQFSMEVQGFANVGEQVIVTARMPLSELIRDFDDQMKSVSAGFASFTYTPDGDEPAELKKLEILIAGSVEPALTRIVPAKDVEREGRLMVERLKTLLPQQQFSQALQAQVDGRIIARETIGALKKDVTGYLYGGDRSRKMKLWKKQQRGKERLKDTARVRVPLEVFREILKK
jgi:GTP-binding protein LepA